MKILLRLLRLPLVAGLIVLAVSCRAGLIARYRIIEPDDLYALCLPESRPAWCVPRDTLIYITYTFSFGYAAVAAAVLAWWCRGRMAWWCAVIALLSGGIGLYLYQTGWSALGVLLALLRLTRLEHRAPQAPTLGAERRPL
jgi:hypothetical protein